MKLLSELKKTGESGCPFLRHLVLGVQRGWGTLGSLPPGAGRRQEEKQRLEASASHWDTCWLGVSCAHGLPRGSPQGSESLFLRLLFLCCDVVINHIFRGEDVKGEGRCDGGGTQAGPLLGGAGELGPG